MSCTFFIVSADVLPQFWGDLSNVTVPVGREASFTCNIKNLGNYKVSQFFQESKLYNFSNVQNESQFSIMLEECLSTTFTTATVERTLHCPFRFSLTRIPKDIQGSVETSNCKLWLADGTDTFPEVLVNGRYTLRQFG